MPEVIGDPDEIEAFARELEEYCQSTIENLQRVRSHLQEMESARTWADSRYQQYREMFDEIGGRITQTIDEIKDQHLPHLSHIAERLRAVLES
jgi:phage-related minor tail protein